MKTKLFVVKKSIISGKGVFAFQNLKENEELGVAFKKILSTGNVDKDYLRTDLGVFVNHSKNNNLILKQKNKTFVYITKGKIKKDEELLLNYEDFPWGGKRDFI